MATDQAYSFSPTYAYPPGETLAEVLESRSMSQVELAERTGLTPKTVNEIIKGKAPVTPDTALHLERVLGLPAGFWNNLQRRFEEVRAREAEARRLEHAAEWARRFPMRKMAEFGWCELPKGKIDRVRTLLNFFGTATPDAWEARWKSVKVAFRSATRFKIDHDALACWLRQGEIEGTAVDTEPYDQDAFREALDTARDLTTLPGVEFLERLREVCAAAGVAVVFVPELPRVRTYGATRWLSPQKALIQLSLRQKSDDQLWFSFFHEAAHILFHPKRAVFLEQGDSKDDLERQADRFARDHLIPEEQYEAFIERDEFDAESITELAGVIGVAPGIVVGRLQHDGHLYYKTLLNRLKNRYRFTHEYESLP